MFSDADRFYQGVLLGQLMDEDRALVELLPPELRERAVAALLARRRRDPASATAPPPSPSSPRNGPYLN